VAYLHSIGFGGRVRINGDIEMVQLWWVGLLMIVLSIAGNAIVRTITMALFDIPPEFRPLAWSQFIFFTVVGAVGATVVFAIVARLSQRPIRLFRRIAIGVLLISFLPDIGLLVGRPFPGITVPGVLSLMVMHVVSAVVAVGLLTRLAREE
jgi:hypothetical protein